MDPSQYTVEAFQPHVGSEFLAATEAGEKLALTLIEVTPGPVSPKTLQFSLLFRAPQGAPMRQRMFHLEHAKLGGLSLLLVPVAEEDGAVMVQAVFNRLVRDSAAKQ